MAEQPNFGYTVDIDDFPGRTLPAGVTVDQVAEMLEEFGRYYPAAVLSLAHVEEPKGE
jgi:hypothetical protein